MANQIAFDMRLCGPAGCSLTNEPPSVSVYDSAVTGGTPPCVKRYRLVMFSRCLPHEGIDHAGGEYVQRVVTALAKSVDVTVVVLDTPADRVVASRPNLPYRPLVVPWRGIYGHPAFTFLRRVQDVFFPLSSPLGLRPSVAASSELAALCSEADVVDVQWTEMLWAWRSISKKVGSKRTVVTALDVLSQRYGRLARTSRGVRKVWGWFRWMGVPSRERKLLRLVDAVVTLSEKDANLVRQLGYTGDVRVITPPLDAAAMEQDRVPDPLMALFVGNFARRENKDGCDWLLREIWPSVRRVLPSARLVIAGVHSDIYLDTFTRDLKEGVEATGYRDTLDSYYRRAGVALIPIRLGAGVKFKTLTAMLWGVPIISTPEGTEGLASNDFYVGVTSDAAQFAELVITAMSDPGMAASKSMRAQEWARSHTAVDEFTTMLRDVHGMANT